ncbi:MAG: hypothetical protein L6R38_004421 [Xanthoria sp. 2 TBL-2021]|nr:MAG: hypothetical protein L6R38_004421 [Xanthoria sp. 2 TBL-2021]
MVRFLLPALLGMAGIRHVATTPLPGSTNLTLPSRIDEVEDQGITAHVAVQGTQLLDMDSCLMATAKMLHSLSGFDVDDVIGPASYVCRPFTTVTISIRGISGARDLPVRFAIWGAYLVGRWLAQYRISSNIVFALLDNRSVIGYIEFARTTVQLSPSRSSNDTQDQTHTSDTSWDAQLEAAAKTYGPGDMTLVSPLDDHLQIFVGFRELRDQAFTKFELFANIYLQLAHIGAFPPRQRIEGRWTLSSPIFPRSQTVFAPEGSPSVVEYRHAADAFLTTAFRVIQRRVVHGLAIRIKAAERFIARGLIWCPRRSVS